MRRVADSYIQPELAQLVEVLRQLKSENQILLAMLYGSFANCNQHSRSDVDLAVPLPFAENMDEISVIR